MSSKYAIKVRISDLPLITLLNGGDIPKIEKKSYLVFEVLDGGATINGKIVTERELGQEYEIAGNSPLLLRLKK